MRMVLVSCVKSKRPSACAAEELYTSPLFKGMRAWAKAQGERWAILSAQYGLLDPQAVVGPYEKTLNKMGKADRQAWGLEVLNQLLPRLQSGDEVVFLAGEKYRELLLAPLIQHGVKVTVPMQGLPMGRQLQWLQKEAAEGRV